MSSSNDLKSNSRQNVEASYELSHNVLDWLLEGFQVISPDFRYLYLNDSASRHGRRKRDELIGRTMMEEYPGIENTEMFSILRRCMTERTPLQMENEFFFPGGLKGWFDLRFEPVPSGVAILSIDITQRKLAEKAHLRSNRALAVVSECNQALVRASDERDLLHCICKIAVDRGGYRLAWIGLKTEGLEHAVLPVASAGEDEGYTASLDIKWDDSPRGRGPTGKAIRTGETVIARRLATENDYEPWRRKALERGFASSIALPFSVDGDIAGSLNIYSSEPEAFDESEKAVLEELALDLGYGISTLRARIARREVDARYRALFENSLDAVLLTSPDGRILSANPAACRLFGRTEDEICRVGRLGLVDPDDPRLPLLLEQRARTGKSAGQLTMRRKDGTKFEAEVGSAIFESADGPRTSVVIHDVTVRVEAETRLKRSEERYRDLYDNAPDMFLSIDAGTATILRCNDTLARTIGRLKHEIVGSPLLDLYHTDSKKDARRAFERFLATGEVHDTILKLVCSDGGVVDVSLSVSAVRDAKGNVVESRSVLRDISELKKAQEELMESEQRYRLLLEHAPVGIAVHSDEKVVFSNPADARILGFDSPAELVGTPVRDIVHPDGWTAARDRISRLVAGEQGLYPTEDRYVRKDGSIADVEVMAVPHMFKGRPAVQVIVTDITERKKAEDALRSSEERYRRLAENLPDMVWRINAEGVFLFVNGSVSGFIGYDRGGVVNKPMVKYLAPSSIDRFAAWLEELQKNPVNRSILLAEVEYIHKEGWAVPGELHAVPVFDDEGRLSAIEGVTRDIRERRRSEKEKGEMMAQLQMSQKLESIGRLAGGVAHDFNNLLSVIISYAGFAADELNASDPVREDIMEIQRAGQRAAALTRQLLAFSRKQILKPEVLDLNKVVSEIESMLQRLLGEDIKIEVRLAESVENVMADPWQIEQVIMNLAVNARDAMLHGGELIIETANVYLDEDCAEQHFGLKPGRYALLSVTDTGIGMSAEIQEHIFEPFFTTKERGKGTGLGLSTVYGIIKQSGGNIIVSSEPGQGTTFSTYLPIVAAATARVERRPPSSVTTGGETVLVVEDEDAVRRIAKRILQNAGYKVLTAATGGEALLLCEKHVDIIDLLLTDVVMPNMSGRELADRLVGQYPNLRVLYMTGYTDDAIVHHGVLDPGTRFVDKPFAAAELTRKVREVLDED